MTHPKMLSVLLLEDQGLVRAGMRALIQITEPDARICEASSYDSAINSLSEDRFDIAFLDIDLKSERTGVDVLSHIKDNLLDTRAIILSGRSDKQTVIDCITLGASGYIVKDMDDNGIFRRALDTVFQGSIFLPPSVIARGNFIPTAPAISTKSEPLTLPARAQEVLFYLCQGLPNKVIADRMGVEEGTVRKDYVPKLFRAFGVARRTELVIEVARRGVVLSQPLRR